MRRTLVLLAALGLIACGQSATQSASQCEQSASHEVTWSNAGAPDIVTARADGPTCAQAVVTFTIRNSAGDPLWAFASTYVEMTAGGVPPDGVQPVSGETMAAFLSGWADVTEMRAQDLPEWREDAPTLTESATTFAYNTPFDRETYEMLRGRNMAMLCFAAAVEASQCLIIDPASNAPTMMVAYGP